MPSLLKQVRRKQSLLDIDFDNDVGLRMPTPVANPLTSPNPAYKNVLTFPKTLEHLKYFETNPHPEKFPDKDVAIFEAFNKKKDLNPDPRILRMDFERVKQQLEPYLSDRDRRLLRLHDEMQRRLEVATDESERIVCRHLDNAFLNYFSTSLDPDVVPHNLWVPFSFAADTRLAKSALADLTANLINPASTANLERKLQKIGAFGQDIQPFYFWNTEPRYWPEVSIQSRPVIYYDKFEPLTYFNYIIPQFKALGNHNFDALPEGFVKPLEDGRYLICVDKMFYFVKDCFNFDGNAFLGLWPLNPGDEATANLPYDTALGNVDFEEYKRHGFGRDFPVLSKLQLVQDFVPFCWVYPRDK